MTTNSARGDLEAGEAQKACSAVGVRQRGASWHYIVVMCVLIWGGYAIGWGLCSILEKCFPSSTFDPALGGLLGMAVGWFAYFRFGRWLVVNRFRKNMTARGLETRLQYDLSLSETGLTLICGKIQRTADWTAVTELFKTKGYWIFLVQMEPWFAPIRFFANVDQERAFVQTALGYLTEDAKKRSASAVAFGHP